MERTNRYLNFIDVQGVKITIRINARNVKKNLSLRKKIRCIVQTHVGHVTGSVPVYNLQVDGSHEFFANNILVHNCDALAYQLEIAYKPQRGVKKQEFVYLSPAWYEDRFAEVAESSSISNPHLYKN